MKTVVIPTEVARRVAKVLQSDKGFLRNSDPLLSAAISTFNALIPPEEPPPTGPTPGPYRIGRRGCIVSDHPVPNMDGSDCVNYYGGHLIAESIAPQNAPLLVASWDLYLACVAVLDAHGPDYMAAVTDAVAKVRGAA